MPQIHLKLISVTSVGPYIYTHIHYIHVHSCTYIYVYLCIYTNVFQKQLQPGWQDDVMQRVADGAGPSLEGTKAEAAAWLEAVAQQPGVDGCRCEFLEKSQVPFQGLLERGYRYRCRYRDMDIDVHSDIYI